MDQSNIDMKPTCQDGATSGGDPGSDPVFVNGNITVRKKLNDITVKDVYPIPRVDDVMNTLQESKYFSAIDHKSSFSSFIFITMDRKKVCKKSSAKKKMKSIELKREIIEKHEQGVRVVDLSRQYGRSTSMICSVLKRKESINSVTPAKGLTIISKLRTSLHENMEKLLMVWVTEKQLQGDTLTQTIICEKARAIYGDLLKQTPQTSINEASEESFKASRGWFENLVNDTGPG
ncbi:hypothetical protein LAZ67_4003318 [Cordylochernes scorpioides]|uniref:HTH CENPB-type domain-containing protein n=1 Tax=Cordylochernes scorpioides TaxID=51811 RepID=A0ABY6KDI9_9ARAC|nr:hypothetical protein LAZ67_4003318 [Cordylochernes scorpioides]